MTLTEQREALKEFSEKTPTADVTSPIDKSRFTDKSVLVTGGASGIGAAVVRMYAAAGAYVVIADLNEQSGQQLESELIQAGYKARFIQVNVADWDSQVALFHKALEFFPNRELDFLLAAAGVAQAGLNFEPADPAELKPGLAKAPVECVDINLYGVIYSTYLASKYAMGLHKIPKAEGPHISGHNHDKAIVVVSSLAGYFAIPYAPDYTISKFGVRGLFRAQRSILPGYGVRLNLLAPYYAATNMTKDVVAALEAEGHKLASVENCAEAVARMTADKSINGRAFCIHADGYSDLNDDVFGGDGSDVKIDLIVRKVLKGVAGVGLADT